jgi:prevent-host-death family protein
MDEHTAELTGGATPPRQQPRAPFPSIQGSDPRVSGRNQAVPSVQLRVMSEVYPMGWARAVLGSLVRRAAGGQERITITDHGHPAAVLVGAQDLEDLEDSAALAEYRLRQAQGRAEPAIPHDEVRRRLGLPTR